MKNSGLSNRFSARVRAAWLYWYSCMICGRNRQDALHHILSPSSLLYVKGEHNESAYNSCPIHNYGCHIDNEAYLYKDSTIKMLLKKTKAALDEEGYAPIPLDRQFLQVYAKLYD